MPAPTAQQPALKSSVESQVTDAEKILIRALTSAHEIQIAEQHVSSRDGVDEEFDPARQAHFVLRNEPLHHGLATESLVEALLIGPRISRCNVTAAGRWRAQSAGVRPDEGSTKN